jgi:hypothetical protein
MLPLIQVLLTALMLAYAGYWRRRQTKRRSETWDDIVCKLRPNDWGYEDVAHRYLYSDRVDATPENIWQRISGAKGLWAMYVNAPVLVQLADYASQHADGTQVPEEVLEGIRSDAFQIRMCVLMALAQHLLSRSTVASRVSAHRATVAYTAMLARITAAFQDHSALLFPKFLDAM